MNISTVNKLVCGTLISVLLMSSCSKKRNNHDSSSTESEMSASATDSIIGDTLNAALGQSADFYYEGDEPTGCDEECVNLSQEELDALMAGLDNNYNSAPAIYTPQFGDLSVIVGGKREFISEERWNSMRRSERNNYRKEGIYVEGTANDRDGNPTTCRFILSLNYPDLDGYGHPACNWKYVMEHPEVLASLPNETQAKVLSSNASVLDDYLKLYGGDRFYGADCWINSPDHTHDEGYAWDSGYYKNSVLWYKMAYVRTVVSL